MEGSPAVAEVQESSKDLKKSKKERKSKEEKKEKKEKKQKKSKSSKKETTRSRAGTDPLAVSQSSSFELRTSTDSGLGAPLGTSGELRNNVKVSLETPVLHRGPSVELLGTGSDSLPIENIGAASFAAGSARNLAAPGGGIARTPSFHIDEAPDHASPVSPRTGHHHDASPGNSRRSLTSFFTGSSTRNRSQSQSHSKRSVSESSEEIRNTELNTSTGSLSVADLTSSLTFSASSGVAQSAGRPSKTGKDAAQGRTGSMRKGASSADLTAQDLEREEAEFREAFTFTPSETLQHRFFATHNGQSGRLVFFSHYMCFLSDDAALKLSVPMTDVLKRVDKKDRVMEFITPKATYAFQSRDFGKSGPVKAVEAFCQTFRHKSCSLHRAILAGDEQRLRFLLTNYQDLDIDPEAKDFENDAGTILHTACKTGNAKMTQIVLDFIRQRGVPNVNEKDYYGWTAMHVAVSSTAGHDDADEILRMLMEFPGIKLDDRNKDGNTPLHYFCKNFISPNCTELGEQLLRQSQMNVNQTNEMGETPLHKAIFNNAVRLLMVRLLISHGAKVNERTNDIGSDTPLHYAVRWQRPDLIEILLNAGANVTLANKAGLTPYELAMKTAQADPSDKDAQKVLRMLQRVKDLQDWLQEVNIPELLQNFLSQELYLDTLADVDDDMVDSTLEAVKVTGMGLKIQLKRALHSLKEKFHKQEDDRALRRGGSEDLEQKLERLDVRPAKEESSETTKEKREFFSTSDGSGTSWQIRHSDLEYTKPLASGAAGKVFMGIYRAPGSASQGPQRGRTVAIKVLKAIDDGAFEAFKKEFEIMRAVKSPHLVEFLGACLEPKICMVMEFCSHGTLYNVLNAKKVDPRLDWPQALHWMLGTAAGLQTLHSWSPPIYHRDMKSLNILIKEGPSEGSSLKDAVITDFGEARFDNASNMATLGRMAGTIGWLAPELFGGDSFTAKSDIYSTGVVFWEVVNRLCTGEYQRPFAEFPELKTDVQILAAAYENGIRPTLHSSCPEPLTALIRWCWSGEPDDRPTASQVVERLQQLCQDCQEHPTDWTLPLAASANA